MESVACLIEACRSGDNERRAQAWGLIEDGARRYLRRVVRPGSSHASAREDILQELYLYFQRDNFRVLGGFRGSSRGEFFGYIKVITTRFARRFVRRLHRDRCMARGLGASAGPRRAGPTERQMAAVRQELEAAMTRRDRLRLEALSAPSGAAREPARTDRTVRMWRSDLLRKYGETAIAYYRCLN
jgi:hypothetical protein